MKAIFRYMNKKRDIREDDIVKEELKAEYKIADELGGAVEISDLKSCYSDVKSDIYNEEEEKFLVQITEWFTLLLILVSHNVNIKELGKDPQGGQDGQYAAGEEEGKTSKDNDGTTSNPTQISVSKSQIDFTKLKENLKH